MELPTVDLAELLLVDLVKLSIVELVKFSIVDLVDHLFEDLSNASHCEFAVVYLIFKSETNMFE